MSIQAMKQALEALEYMHTEKCDYMRRNHLGDPLREDAARLAIPAITALRAAIHEAERHEPVTDDKLLFLQVFSIREALQMPPIEAIEQAIEFIEGVHQGEWSGKFSRYETLANLHALREDMKSYTKWLAKWAVGIYFAVAMIGKLPISRDDSNLQEENDILRAEIERLKQRDRDYRDVTSGCPDVLISRDLLTKSFDKLYREKDLRKRVAELEELCRQLYEAEQTKNQKDWTAVIRALEKVGAGSTALERPNV